MSGAEAPVEIAENASRALRGLTWQRAALALGVLLVLSLVAKLAGYLLRRALSKGNTWGGPVFALSKLLTYFLVFVGFVAALSLLGVPLSSLLLTSSALLVGIGFSLQHIMRDFIAGIVLLVEQPVRKDDFVTFGDTAGTVLEIGLRATHLLTRDGTDLVVPNHLLVTTEVANHSHPLPRARVLVDVPVSLLEDVDVVAQTLISVAEDHPRILIDPRPAVTFRAIKDSAFKFTLVAWVRDPPATFRVASELRFAIARAFARTGVRFPTPELLLHAGPGPSDPHLAGADPAR